MATTELGEHDAGVWAMAADAQGQLLITGTEDGCVAAIDARGRRTPWQVLYSPFFSVNYPSSFSSFITISSAHLSFFYCSRAWSADIR